MGRCCGRPVAVVTYRKCPLGADVRQRPLHVRDAEGLGAVPVEEAIFVRQSGDLVNGIRVGYASQPAMSESPTHSSSGR